MNSRQSMTPEERAKLLIFPLWVLPLFFHRFREGIVLFYSGSLLEMLEGNLFSVAGCVLSAVFRNGWGN